MHEQGNPSGAKAQRILNLLRHSQVVPCYKTLAAAVCSVRRGGKANVSHKKLRPQNYEFANCSRNFCSCPRTEPS